MTLFKRSQVSVFKTPGGVWWAEDEEGIVALFASPPPPDCEVEEVVRSLPKPPSKSHYAFWRRQGGLVAPIIKLGLPPAKAMKLLEATQPKEAPTQPAPAPAEQPKAEQPKAEGQTESRPKTRKTSRKDAGSLTQ